MALNQVDAVQLGPVVAGGSQASSSQIFSSTTTMGVWSSGTSYAVNNAVEYSGAVYRSLVGSNLGNTPSSSPADWLLILPTVKDGDACHVVAGYLSDINIRQNGTWQSVLNVPAQVSLPNNTSGNVASFPLAVARAATIQYSIVNNGSYQIGTLRYESDGTSVVISDSGNVSIDGPVGITFDASVVSSNVVISYVSTNVSVSPATFSFTIQKWT